MQNPSITPSPISSSVVSRIDKTIQLISSRHGVSTSNLHPHVQHHATHTRAYLCDRRSEYRWKVRVNKRIHLWMFAQSHPRRSVHQHLSVLASNRMESVTVSIVFGRLSGVNIRFKGRHQKREEEEDDLGGLLSSSSFLLSRPIHADLSNKGGCPRSEKDEAPSSSSWTSSNPIDEPLTRPLARSSMLIDV